MREFSRENKALMVAISGCGGENMRQSYFDHSVKIYSTRFTFTISAKALVEYISLTVYTIIIPYSNSQQFRDQNT